MSQPTPIKKPAIPQQIMVDQMAKSPIEAPERPQYEFIDCKELGRRWAVPESWVREQVRLRAADPLPHVRFGKYVRFRWGSPDLEDWAERRIIYGSNRKSGRILGKEIQ